MQLSEQLVNKTVRNTKRRMSKSPNGAENAKKKRPSDRNIKVTLINVCGLKTRFKNAKFSDYINKFDIILLRETKLDTLDSISVPGFHLLIKNRKHKKRASGGIALLISDELTLVNYVCELDVEQADFYMAEN